MQLEELFDYKNAFMGDLLTNKTIVELINDDISLENSSSLVYEQVFPYEFIPDTVEHGKTFVCVDVDISRAINKTFLLPTLFVWVFTHKSLLKLPQGGVRTDKLCSEIAKTINGSREYGLGELELTSVKRFAPITDFQGKVMVFNAKDFNRLHDPNKYAPANRKSK